LRHGTYSSIEIKEEEEEEEEEAGNRKEEDGGGGLILQPELNFNTMKLTRVKPN